MPYAQMPIPTGMVSAARSEIDGGRQNGVTTRGGTRAGITYRDTVLYKPNGGFCEKRNPQQAFTCGEAIRMG